jgi:hypothetical protein
MSDRGILFLFSLAIIVLTLGTSGWLIASGQAASVDGLFLLLTCLLTALAFALYVMFMIHRAQEALRKPAAQPAKPAAQKTAPATTTSSQPV